MSNILCAILLTPLLIVPAIIAYKRSKDFFSPICFFNAYSFISTIPRLLFMENNLYTGRLDGSTVERYFVITALNICIINFVFFLLSRSLHHLYQDNINNQEKAESEMISIPFVYFLFFIGVFSKVYLLMKSGGIAIIWSNINARTRLLAGNNYINNLEIFLMVSSALILYKYLKSGKQMYTFSLIFIFTVSSLLLLSFGGRAGFVRLIFALLFVANYKKGFFDIKRILRPRMLLLIGIMVLIIVMIPMVRSSEFQNIYTTPGLWIQSGFKNIGSIFENISSVDRDMCAYDIFSDSERWLGKSYVGILTSWIPSSLYPDKPPVDDGVYLANLINGFQVAPVMPYRSIPLHSSSPFSSMGIMYANFGIVGVVFGSILLAIAYLLSYRSLVNSGRSISRVLVYSYMMILFGLSVHSILSLLIPAILIGVALHKRKYHIILGRHKIL